MGLSREMASVLRYEIDMCVLNAVNRVTRRARSGITRFIGDRTEVKLQLGSGTTVAEDWLNLDCYAPRLKYPNVVLVDLRKGIPLPDEAVKFIFSEHMLEHLDHEEYVPRLLKECLRVLERGGAIRFVVPDGGALLSAYRDEGHPLRTVFPLAEGRGWMDFVNDVASGGSHKYLYDDKCLKRDLADAGFCEVQRMKPGESAFRGLCLDDPDDGRRQFSLYMEASKP
jgi:predicted SAM-dependent methyltransferase